MPTKKIAELPEVCQHPEHEPPRHQVFTDGVYEHTCPACGHVTVFTVRNVRCEHHETPPALVFTTSPCATCGRPLLVGEMHLCPGPPTTPDQPSSWRKTNDQYQRERQAIIGDVQPYQRTFLERWLGDSDRGPRFSVRRSRR